MKLRYIFLLGILFLAFGCLGEKTSDAGSNITNSSEIISSPKYNTSNNGSNLYGDNIYLPSQNESCENEDMPPLPPDN